MLNNIHVRSQQLIWFETCYSLLFTPGISVLGAAFEVAGIAKRMRGVSLLRESTMKTVS